jgi:hypothetical protein
VYQLTKRRVYLDASPQVLLFSGIQRVCLDKAHGRNFQSNVLPYYRRLPSEEGGKLGSGSVSAMRETIRSAQDGKGSSLLIASTSPVLHGAPSVACQVLLHGLVHHR